MRLESWGGERDGQDGSLSDGGVKAVAVVDNGSVQVSEQDDRLYRHITLSNQMQVLLIHDAGTDKEAAAMDVRVGQTSDPAHLQGTAHFCEHMLFMGTGKYPDENAYNAFLNDNGGNSNAFTSDENTNYYFDVNAGHLEGALDIFSRFFIDPLFTESATGRELTAIDNENSKNLMSDPWRLVQLLKAVSSREHPWHQFGTGNAKTLGEDPKKAGVDIRAELLRFHERYYSANLMRLVVLGSATLDELQDIVVKRFHPVVNTNASPLSFNGKVPFGPDQLRRRLNVVPVKDLREVMMSWPLPPVDKHFRSKPDGYLSHLAGHEGKGSLLSLLKRKGWANGLSAGPYESATDWSNFVVSVDCTESGMDHVNEIVSMTYQYLNMIREEGIQEWIYLETKAIAEMNFRFQSKGNPMSYVSRLAGGMQIYPPELSIAGSSLLYDYDPDLVRDLLSRIVPSNMLLVVVGRKFKGTTDKVEHWYGTEYSSESLSEELLQSWMACGRHPELHLPEPNPVIATDFELRPPPPAGAPPGPSLVRDDASCRLWYRGDGVFRKPKLNVRVRLATPALYDSPESAVMSDLLMNLLTEDLNEELYMARQAGLGLDLFISKDALNLNIGGYNHKMKVLLDRCIKHMTHFPHTLETAEIEKRENGGGGGAKVHACARGEAGEGSVSRRADENSDMDLFLRVREKVRKRYKNLEFSPPYQHAMFATLCCLEVPKWSNEDKLAAIEGPGVTASTMRAFIPRLLSTLHVEMLVHGNATAAEALELASVVMDGLAARPLPPYLWPDCRVVDLASRNMRAARAMLHGEGDYDADRAGAILQPRSLRQACPASRREAVSAAVSNGSRAGQRDAHKTEMEFVMGPSRETGTDQMGTEDRGVEYRLCRSCPNKEEENSAIEITYQVCLDGVKGRAMLGLLTHLIKDKFFNQLRTKEQLGYLVWSGGSVHGGYVYNARFMVQSKDRSPRYLDQRVEAFLASFRETLEALTPETFAANVRAVVEIILEKDKNLNQETVRFWEEILCRAYLFDRDAKEAAAVAALTIPELLEFYDWHFPVGGGGRRKMASWVYGNQHSLRAEGPGAVVEEDEAEKERRVEGVVVNGEGGAGEQAAAGEGREDDENVVLIEDYHGFKRSMPLLPLRKHPDSVALKPSKL